MKTRCILIIGALYLFSCSPAEEKESKGNMLVGNWKSDSFQIHFVHAVFSKLNEGHEAINGRITSRFSISFKKDSTFVFTNEDGTVETGNYKLADSSLILNNGQLEWLSFQIARVAINKLYLYMKRVLFYSIENDTVTFYTGDDVKLILKKTWQANNLEDKKQTIKLQYLEWFCACANWATLEDIKKCRDTGALPAYCMFIEPDTPTLTLPDTLGYNGDIVEFTGQFYVDKGYPKDYIKAEEQVEKARVFRYSSYRVIESNYRHFQDMKAEGVK
jgi:hypothetical protein